MDIDKIASAIMDRIEMRGGILKSDIVDELQRHLSSQFIGWDIGVEPDKSAIRNIPGTPDHETARLNFCHQQSGTVH